MDKPDVIRVVSSDSNFNILTDEKVGYVEIDLVMSNSIISKPVVALVQDEDYRIENAIAIHLVQQMDISMDMEYDIYYSSLVFYARTILKDETIFVKDIELALDTLHDCGAITYLPKQKKLYISSYDQLKWFIEKTKES
jgi:hypothetical protein